MKKNKIIFTVSILSMIVLIFSGCIPFISPEPEENSFSEEFVLVQVTDSESNLIFVTGKENEDAMAILGDKDTEGNPTGISGAVYVSEQGDSFAIEAGIDGLPTYIIDSEGNTVIFENYTNSTVDVSIYDSNGIPIQGPTTINVDPADLLELKQLYNSFYSKQRWSMKNTADALKWGAVGLSWTGCAISTAVSTATVAATVGISIATCANAMTSTIAAITPDDTDNMVSITTGISSCALDPTIICLVTNILSIVGLGIEQQTPLSPTPLSPGSSSAPGSIIYTLTPTLTWAEVDNADYYDVAIKEYPYNTNIIYNFQEIYGSSFVVPSERLETWKKYCWNVRAHNSNGFGNYSETLYFQIENVNELLTITTITASAGPHGSISPLGDQIVNFGSDQSFTITPDTGYQIADVLVDGSSIGAVNSYTFTNVTEDHTISATFKSSESVILSSITVSPSTISLVEGGSQTISSITAHYSDGGTADIALDDCTYSSSNSGVATVNTGVIIAVIEGIATITVSYIEESITKTDTVEVTVTSTVISQAPYIPNNPSPTDNSLGVLVNTDLGWTGGDPDPEDTVTYDVYFEANDSSPDILVSNDQSNTTYNPGILNYDTHYYWKIIAKDNHGQKVSGSIWDFTTEDQSSILSFTGLTPSQISTSTAPYQATLSASGSNFNNVNRVSFSWSGAASGSATWYKGDTNWNTKVTVNSDTSMTLKPGVVETNPTWSGTAYWTVTLRDTTGATASRSFTVTYTQLTPQVTGVDPSQPTANPSRQYIDILGNNFASNAQVTLQISSSVYPIPDDRTYFINSARIEVYVGLTDSGNWKVWITNPDGQKSNEYIFYVKP